MVERPRRACTGSLQDALVAHLGVTVGRDGVSHPLVLPTAYAVDLDGPDQDGTLYVHGSVAAGWLRTRGRRHASASRSPSWTAWSRRARPSTTR